jgi:hypothetical protein
VWGILSAPCLQRLESTRRLVLRLERGLRMRPWILGLKRAAIALTLGVVIFVVLGTFKIGLPPVPLDSEGNSAPYGDFASSGMWWP